MNSFNKSPIEKEVMIEEFVVSGNTGNVVFKGLKDDYFYYYLIGKNISPTIDDQRLVMRLSNDNGATFAGVTEFSQRSESSGGFGSDSTFPHIRLQHTGTGTGNRLGMYDFKIFNIGLDDAYPYVMGNSAYIGSNGEIYTSETVGTTGSRKKCDAIEISFESGDISKGEFRLYGVK